ncbi:hypothetical protein F8M41_000905 [Gigaspora margarita]|uniref:Uncharacterized protein n=1 Tax=Gigaspora margarita TaxID=4874 RepID=A0A8H3XGQ6_GIGMA|nr:hypothetical protein F8M41_000905 [Gigaspora margarita]
MIFLLAFSSLPVNCCGISFVLQCFANKLSLVLLVLWCFWQIVFGTSSGPSAFLVICLVVFLLFFGVLLHFAGKLPYDISSGPSAGYHVFGELSLVLLLFLQFSGNLSCGISFVLWHFASKLPCGISSSPLAFANELSCSISFVLQHFTVFFWQLSCGISSGPSAVYHISSELPCSISFVLRCFADKLSLVLLLVLWRFCVLLVNWFWYFWSFAISGELPYSVSSGPLAFYW